MLTGPRRTKIVATLGPATDDPEVLDRLVGAGVDVVRLNLSHGSHEQHRARVEEIRKRSHEKGRPIGVLMDLQGPKIRIGRFRDGPVRLKEKDAFTLDTHCDPGDGDGSRVGVTFPDLVSDVSRGDTLLLDDGAVELWVDRVEEGRINCRVVVGGILSDGKGINKKGGGLSAPALTNKDRSDISFAAAIEADFLAVSFVRNADDVNETRRLLREAGSRARIVAKIERADAVDAAEEIVEATDAIMIARGDLGVEIGDAELPAVQKRLIKLARSRNRVVVTATQMMESMIENPIPTRAEVFDVANAVLDGTDAVMLSGETAMGRYPVMAVEAMNRVCREAEKQTEVLRSDHRLNSVFGRVDEAIAMATMYTANHLDVTVIAALTESGSTCKWMSRISSGIPIYALTAHESTRRRVTLFRGVNSIEFNPVGRDVLKVNQDIVNELKERGLVHDGDLILVTKGDLNGVEGGTNVMKIIRVGEYKAPDQDVGNTIQ